MIFYIPFGDWSDDGHGRYETVLVKAKSMKSLLEAQKKIKAKYGSDFFHHMAGKYQDSSIGEDVIQALKDTNYDGEYNEDYNDVEEISDMFIHLLNAFGAGIEPLEEYEQINNWTCSGFETVGYGCFC